MKLTDLLIILASVFATACLIWFALQIVRAPEGYEDDKGFHLGRPDDRNPQEKKDTK